jgi:hypothetical protein
VVINIYRHKYTVFPFSRQNEFRADSIHSSNMQLFIVATLAFLMPSYLHAYSDNPSNPSLDWMKDKWTIESPRFTRFGNATAILSSTGLEFKLYYNKWGACNRSARVPAASSSPLDPELCGLDFDASEVAVRCSLNDDGMLGDKYPPIPWPKTLWRPCVGRWLPKIRDERCKGLNLTQKIAGVGGCKFRGPLEEDRSERPWLRWRIAAFDEGAASTVDLNGISSTYFRSMTVEMINGQRSVYRLCLYYKCSQSFPDSIRVE